MTGLNIHLQPSALRMLSLYNGFWDFRRTRQFGDHFSSEHRTILAGDGAREPKLSPPPRVFRALNCSYARPWVLAAEPLMGDCWG